MHRVTQRRRQCLLLLQKKRVCQRVSAGTGEWASVQTGKRRVRQKAFIREANEREAADASGRCEGVGRVVLESEINAMSIR